MNIDNKNIFTQNFLHFSFSSFTTFPLFQFVPPCLSFFLSASQGCGSAIFFNGSDPDPTKNLKRIRIRIQGVSYSIYQKNFEKHFFCKLTQNCMKRIINNQKICVFFLTYKAYLYEIVKKN